MFFPELIWGENEVKPLNSLQISCYSVRLSISSRHYFLPYIGTAPLSKGFIRGNRSIGQWKFLANEIVLPLGARTESHELCLM